MWLKTHYPAEFFAAALTILGEDKHQGLVKDALTYSIRVLPPDVNVSSNRIEIRTLEDGSQVLYAPFSAVKGCSENGCQAITFIFAFDAPFTYDKYSSVGLSRNTISL